MGALTQFPNTYFFNKHWHAGVCKPNRRRPALGVFDNQTSGGPRAAALLARVSPKVFSEQINPQIEQHVLYGRRQAPGDKFLVPMDPAQFSGIRFSRARRVANSFSSSGAESLRVCIHLVPTEKSLVGPFLLQDGAAIFWSDASVHSDPPRVGRRECASRRHSIRTEVSELTWLARCSLAFHQFSMIPDTF